MQRKTPRCSHENSNGPQQPRLIPDALQDWLPENQLAHFVGDTVDQLDLSAFHVRYAKGGPHNLSLPPKNALHS